MTMHLITCLVFTFILTVLPEGTHDIASRQSTLNELPSITGSPSRDRTPGQEKPKPVTAKRSLQPPNTEILSTKRLSAVHDPTDLLKQTVVMMDITADRIGHHYDLGLPPQRLQQSIIANLDQMSGQIAHQQPSNERTPSSPHANKKGGNNPSTGSQNLASSQKDISTNRNGAHSDKIIPTGVGPLPLEQSNQQWGHLPPHIRSELLQGIGEPYSPMYRSATAAYFRRIAEDIKSR